MPRTGESVCTCKLLSSFKIRREFEKFDENEDGLIDQVEFGQFLRGIGLIPSDDDVKVGIECKEFFRRAQFCKKTGKRLPTS